MSLKQHVVPEIGVTRPQCKEHPALLAVAEAKELNGINTPFSNPLSRKREEKLSTDNNITVPFIVFL